MPNINNFKSNIVDLGEQYIKYTVSRIVSDKSNNLLEMEIPATFSTQNIKNNVEINLYSLADNSLVFSDFIKNTEALRTETLQYNDNTSRTLLYIDFAKVPELQLPDGQYSVTLNFFEEELGSYDNSILKVSKISTSRTEVELELMDLVKQKELEQFAIPSIPSSYIPQVLVQIFNQEGADDIVIPTSPVKIDSMSLYTNFSSGSGEKLLQYNFDEDDGSRLGINTITQNVLNIAYPIAMENINVAISTFNSSSFTEVELSNIVLNAIDVAYDTTAYDEAQNPQNYRFDLI